MGYGSQFEHTPNCLPPMQNGRQQGVLLPPGLAANRPLPSWEYMGYEWLSTDVGGGTLYYCNGAAWIQIAAGVTAASATVVVADAAGDTTTFPVLAGSATGSLPMLTDAELTYNATTNVLSAGSFAGAAALVGGSITELTTFGLQDTSADFDVILAATSTGPISADRTLTFDVGNVAHTIALGTTANTITFPNAASGTVPFLNLAQSFTAAQTFTAAAPQLVLGVNTSTLGSIKMFGSTSGDATLQPTAIAGTATVQTLPATTGTLVNRVTTANGVSASGSDGALTFTLGAITPTSVAPSAQSGALNMSSHQINSVTDPTSPQDAATMAWTLAQIGALDAKDPVAYCSTVALPANTYANGTLGVGATLTGTVNGPLIIDGVTIPIGGVGLRVLVTGEAAPANNGWFAVTVVGVVAVSKYVLTRATDSDQAAEIGPGYLTAVEAPTGLTPGTANNQKVFISITAVPMVVGTDSLTFALVGGTYTGDETSIHLSGTQFSILSTWVGQTAITTVGTIGTGVWAGTTVAVLHGGTGVTSVTISPTATSFAGWDANSNLSANSFLDGYTTTATAGATTTLLVGSTEQQYFTGTLTQNCKLPVASTLVLGQSYRVVNLSSGVVTVQSSGANTVQAMAANTVARVTCVLTSGTTAASWNVEYYLPGGGGGTVANPTALVGLTAVNGVAVSAIRSDGAPALSQAIAPTWTNPHVYLTSSIASGVKSPQITLLDDTVSDAIASMSSPALFFSAHGWNTGGGGSDSLLDWSVFSANGPGTNAVTELIFGYRSDGGAWSTVLGLTNTLGSEVQISGSLVLVGGNLSGVGDITGGASSMTITSGTGNSRTLTFKTTTAGGAATTALTLAADQSATFANTVNATTFVGALTGNASTATNVAASGLTGTTLAAGVTGSSLTSFGASPTLVTPLLGTPTSGVATNLTGTAAGLTAGKATTLATARAINGVSFDGSAAITLPFVQNYAINSAFNYAQAATPGGATVAFTVGGSDVYFFDQWKCNSDKTDSSWTLSRATSAPHWSPNYFKAVRDTSSAKILLGQIIENKVAGALSNAGATVTFQAWVKMPTGGVIVNIGVLEWSGTADAPTKFTTAWSGTATTDPTFNTSYSMKGKASSATIGNTWVLISTTYAVSASVTNLVPMIWLDAETATTTGELNVAEADFFVGGSTRTWYPPDPARDLKDCQSVFCKTFSTDTKPAQAVGSLSPGILSTVASGTSIQLNFVFPSDMARVPAVTTYNPTQANANWRNNGDTVDATANVTAISTRQCRVAGTVATDQVGYQIHASADSRL